jgi:hypothetical protein
MRIGIEINGVLRNTLGKIEQTYKKFYVEKTEGIELEDDFKYELLSELNTLEIKNHLKFRDDDELFSFLYEEFPMEIFGHAQSTEYSSFNDLNDFYFSQRDKHELIIVSDEIGKSKPASLFFLSKFGCLFEKVIFYSNFTIDDMWNQLDILVTSNPKLIENHPSDKLIIKYQTNYNKPIDSLHTISTLKELESTINQTVPC